MRVDTQGQEREREMVEVSQPKGQERRAKRTAYPPKSVEGSEGREHEKRGKGRIYRLEQVMVALTRPAATFRPKQVQVPTLTHTQYTHRDRYDPHKRTFPSADRFSAVQRMTSGAPHLTPARRRPTGVARSSARHTPYSSAHRRSRRSTASAANVIFFFLCVCVFLPCRHAFDCGKSVSLLREGSLPGGAFLRLWSHVFLRSADFGFLSCFSLFVALTVLFSISTSLFGPFDTHVRTRGYGAPYPKCLSFPPDPPHAAHNSP